LPPLICPITETPPEQTLIVFDKDGVLLDLAATWLPVIIAMGAYLEEKCDGATSKEDLLSAVGVDLNPAHPLGGAIRENSLFAAGTFAEMRGIWSEHEPKLIPVFEDIEAYREDINDIVMSTGRGSTVPKGAVKDGILALKKTGFKMGVATNDNAASTTSNLQDLGIDEQFDIVICADSGYGRKPEGGGLLQASKATGIPPEAAIMVGDTETDYLAALAAGYKGFITIADSAPVAPDFIPRTDAVITGVEGLPEIVLG
jgi:phosphoglycolate phosphatase